MPPHNISDNMTIDAIDEKLPQTQCTLCSYDGCKPYATAIVKDNAPLDRCLPGGVRVMRDLGKLLKQNVSELEAGLELRTRPPAKVTIREDICIGCTKCIQACPVDAIIGTAKKMHRVLTDSCTGCELCIAPCPVDCIDLIPTRQQNPSIEQEKQAAREARDNFNRRQSRLVAQKNRKNLRHKTPQNKKLREEPQANKKATGSSIGLTNRFAPVDDGLDEKQRQDVIARALAKNRARKNQAQPQQSS